MTAAVNPKLIALLERKLIDAKSGKLTTAAVVGHYADGGLMIDTEGEAGPLLIGAVQLQEQMRQAMFMAAPQQAHAPQFGTRRLSS